MRSMKLQAASKVCLPAKCIPKLRVHPAQRPRLAVKAHKDGSGIHDPAGTPESSWGSGEKNSRKEHLAQEEAFMMQENDVATKSLRSEQRAGHGPGHVSVNKAEAVTREQQEIADERAAGDKVADKQIDTRANIDEQALEDKRADDERADDEYIHMNRMQKWIMEAKAALYAWLKTGVEPL